MPPVKPMLAKPVTGGERNMLGFETLTLAPIDRRLIEHDSVLREVVERFGNAVTHFVSEPDCGQADAEQHDDKSDPDREN